MDGGDLRTSPIDREIESARRLRRQRVVVLGVTFCGFLSASAVAITRCTRCTLNYNECAAIVALKNLATAQAQIQASGLVDPDGNGQGGYAFLSEMAGTKTVRARRGASPARRSPTTSSAAFGRPGAGRVDHSGYVFEILLPTVDGRWASERDVANGRELDESKCEALWMVYAWPKHFDWSGRRVFLFNQAGDILSLGNEDGRFGGDHGPRGGFAGFVEPVQGARTASNCEDCEGRIWTVVP